MADPQTRQRLYQALVDGGFLNKDKTPLEKFDQGLNDHDTRLRLYEGLVGGEFLSRDKTPFEKFNTGLEPERAPEKPVETPSTFNVAKRKFLETVTSPFSSLLKEAGLDRNFLDPRLGVVARSLDAPLRTGVGGIAHATQSVAEGVDEISRSDVRLGPGGPLGIGSVTARDPQRALGGALKVTTGAVEAPLSAAMIATGPGQAFMAGGHALEEISPRASQFVNTTLAPFSAKIEIDERTRAATGKGREYSKTEKAAAGLGDIVFQLLLFKAGHKVASGIGGKLASGNALSPSEKRIIRDNISESKLSKYIPLEERAKIIDVKPTAESQLPSADRYALNLMSPNERLDFAASRGPIRTGRVLTEDGGTAPEVPIKAKVKTANELIRPEGVTGTVTRTPLETKTGAKSVKVKTSGGRKRSPVQILKDAGLTVKEKLASNGDIVFDDPTTGGTFQMNPKEITAANVNSKMAASREAFARPKKTWQESVAQQQQPQTGKTGPAVRSIEWAKTKFNELKESFTKGLLDEYEAEGSRGALRLADARAKIMNEKPVEFLEYVIQKKQKDAKAFQKDYEIKEADLNVKTNDVGWDMARGHLRDLRAEIKELQDLLPYIKTLSPGLEVKSLSGKVELGAKKEKTDYEVRLQEFEKKIGRKPTEQEMFRLEAGDKVGDLVELSKIKARVRVEEAGSSYEYKGQMIDFMTPEAVTKLKALKTQKGEQIFSDSEIDNAVRLSKGAKSKKQQGYILHDLALRLYKKLSPKGYADLAEKGQHRMMAIPAIAEIADDLARALPKLKKPRGGGPGSPALSVAGVVAGIDVDDEGEISFDPYRGILGALGSAALGSVLFKRKIRLGQFGKLKFKTGEIIEETTSPYKFDVRTRGQRPHETTVESAKQEGAVVLRAIKGNVKPGDILNADEQYAVASEMARRAENRKPGDVPSQEDINVIKAWLGSRSEQGRALEANKIPIDPKVAEFIRTVDPFAKLPEKVPPGFWEKLAEWGRNVKLATFSGLVRSSVGNSVMQVLKYPELFTEISLAKVRDTILGKPSSRTYKELVADLVGMKAGLREGFKAAWEIAQENEKYIMSSEFLRREGISDPAIGGKLGLVVRTPQRLQGAIDAIFRLPAAMGAVGREAVKKAFSEGKRGEDLVLRTQELIDRPTPEMITAAKKSSLYQTFQSELGSFGKGINRMRIEHPTSQLVVPFFSTPANLFKAAVERTPFSVLTPSFHKAYLEAIEYKGSYWKKRLESVTGETWKPGTENIETKMARMFMGSAFLATTGSTIFGVLDGDVTGRAPKDPAERERLQRSGWQPYSVRIGDTYYSYRGFEPVSTWLGLLADFKEGFEKEGLAEALKDVAINLARNFSENPFLTGFSDFMDYLKDPEGTGADRVIAGFALGMTVPTIVQQTRFIADDIVRKPHGLGENIKARIPITTRSLLPRRDVFGEPIRVETPAGRVFATVTSTRKTDPVETELNRLELNLAPPSNVYEGIELTPEQLDKLHEAAGKSFKQTLDILVPSEGYKQLPDGLKVKAIRRVQDEIREVQRAILLTDVRLEGLLEKADKDLQGGIIKEEEKENTLNALRRAIGQ